MFTNKNNSFIDLVRNSEDKPMYHSWMSRYSDPYGIEGIEKAAINCMPDHIHPDHPDYMRMVVHQMD